MLLLPSPSQTLDQDIHKPAALCAISQQEVNVDYTEIFTCGFSCEDVSMYSSNFQSNKKCLSGKEGTDKHASSTTTTFSGMMTHIEAHKPAIVVLENVESIDAAPNRDSESEEEGEAKQTNLDNVIAELKKRATLQEPCLSILAECRKLPRNADAFTSSPFGSSLGVEDGGAVCVCVFKIWSTAFAIMSLDWTNSTTLWTPSFSNPPIPP